MKVLVKAHILKLWFFIKTEIQLIFWYSVHKDVESYVNCCENCQKQGDLKLITNSKLYSITVLSNVMKQVGVDLCGLPEVDGYRCLIICIYYFCKWSESKPITDKTAPAIAQFLYEMVNRHRCFAIQINVQVREFVNEMSDELHLLTGVQLQVTSANHFNPKGLVVRQNRTIKSSLVKVLEENPLKWSSTIVAVLFVHRVSKQSPTKYSSFKLIYNREPVRPIDVKYKSSFIYRKFGS